MDNNGDAQSNSTSNNDAVDQLMDQILYERGMDNLDDDIKIEMKKEMTQLLMDQIDRAAINALPEDKAVELSNKMDDPNFGDDQIAEFMAQSGVDLQQVSLETMLKFREFYLSPEPEEVKENVQQ